MEQNNKALEQKAQYIDVNNIEYQLLDGYTRIFKKHLLTTETLEIDQTMINGNGLAEDYGISNVTRAQYVLEGKATLIQDAANTDIGPGYLIVIPSGLSWGKNLSINSDNFITLDIVPRLDNGSTATSSENDCSNLIRIIRPEDISPYQPAGHAKTINRCLFIDEHMEIIEGFIERGGGADKHSHKNNEQLLYTLGDVVEPLLIYYPKEAPHGTGGGVSEPLKLLVIYSPPLGESQNALK